MLLINAPTPLAKRHIDVYLAGGVTGCPTWQRDVIAALDGTDLTIASSHRDPATAGNDAVTRLEWTRDALLRSRTIVFWFPAEALAPITLLEFGGALERARRGRVNLVVGTGPSHTRRVDIEQYAGAHRHTGVIERNLDAVIARVTLSSEHRRRLMFSPSALID